MATTIEESFFSRSASAGCSCISTTCEAWTIETLAGRAPAIRAQRRLVADEDPAVVGMVAGEVDDARDDLLGAVIAAHRVDGDPDAIGPRLERGGPRLRHGISGAVSSPAGLRTIAWRPW